MMRKSTISILFKTLFGLLLLWFATGFARPLPNQNLDPLTPAQTNVAQGRDYATQVLGSPWDMSNFSEISQGINWISGDYLLNLQNANGVFSASTQSGNSYFFLLYAGDWNSVKAGKIGALYPIQPNSFHCFYLAMNLQTQPPDQVTISWGPDQVFSTFGAAGIPINVSNDWNLYRLDLAGPGWSTQSQIEWFRIMPSIKSGSNIYVDWARLTDCNPINVVLSGLPSGTFSIWVVGSSGKQIRVVSSFSPSGGSYDWDVQGLDADTYTYYVKAGATIIQQGQVVVNSAPIVQFQSPSRTSGVDYATQAGNAWDFNDPSNTTLITRTNAWYANGYLNVSTPSAPLPTGADPVIYLNVPQAINNPGVYRYLTYRIYTQWPWQEIANGMIVRWIWGMANGCDLVSNQIPFDVGWQTYSVDLTDPYNGAVIQAGGNCPPGTPTSWSTTPQITRLRFKPNENALGQNLFQQIDWIRLTQVDQVARGTPYAIQIALNKPPAGVALNYYYTTTTQQPTQHSALQYTGSSSPPAGPSLLFLPMVFRNFSTGAANGISYLWDTGTVTPGQYYICVVANDGYNTTTFCSDAPLNVL